MEENLSRVSSALKMCHWLRVSIVHSVYAKQYLKRFNSCHIVSKDEDKYAQRRKMEPFSRMQITKVQNRLHICSIWSRPSITAYITKARLYNFDPIQPEFYIVKLRFTGVYIIFLILVKKHRLWVLVRTSPRRFLRVPTIYILSRIMKNNWNFYLKIFLFLVVKFSIYLNRRVFVMYGSSSHCRMYRRTEQVLVILRGCFCWSGPSLDIRALFMAHLKHEKLWKCLIAVDTLARFSTILYKGDNFFDFLLHFAYSLSGKGSEFAPGDQYSAPSEKGSTLKEKNLLPLEVNSFILEMTPFQMGDKTILTV